MCTYIHPSSNARARGQGGQGVVDAVLKGKNSFLYTESHMDVVVKSMGFMPIHRTFQANCKILKVSTFRGDS